MDRHLEIIAARAVKDVYDGHCENVGSTEWALTSAWWSGGPIQVLAIGGTDEWLDWVWNLLLLYWDRVKLGSYLSVKRIEKRLEIDPDIPLLVAVHSKSVPTGLKYTIEHGADYCIGFCPAPGLKDRVKMENTKLFIDPDDIVPGAGDSVFVQPDCEIEYLPKDKDRFDIKGRIGDHSMDHILEYLLKGENA